MGRPCGFGALLLLLALAAPQFSSAACAKKAYTADPVAANPGIASMPAYSSTDMFGCSEVVTIPKMPAFTSEPTRSACPHLRTDLTAFETKFPSVAAESEITITGKLLFTACSLPNPAIIIKRITIQSGAELVFDDSDITLHVREILVNQGGAITAGTPTCARWGKLDIIFHGSRTNSGLVLGSTPSKGLVANGNVDLHGKRYAPTWTRLSRTAAVGDSQILVQDAVNWEVGQEVLITTTVFYDCPDQYKATYCGNNAHQNEVVKITATKMDSANKHFVIKLASGLKYLHYAGVEYQAEVALLSRKITLRGSDNGDKFGGHVAIRGSARGRISGVRADLMGQLNVEARYPFHLHMLAENGKNSYIRDSSVTNSFFRGYVIHGTNASTVERNVAYNVMGMCYYLEDGVEERNILKYNLASHVHPISKPANGNWGQGGETFTRTEALFNPADSSAAGFYIINAYNSFIGNAASGGWSGFAFPNTPRPLGSYRALNLGNNNPVRRPTLEFRGNTAHSSGFYWFAHGACLYVGANLGYANGDGTGVMTYTSGRFARSTKHSNGSSAIMTFRDTKVFLCRKGFAHWGNNLLVKGFESHDSTTAAMLFGEAVVDNALVTGRTRNSNGWRQQDKSYDRWCFQFYDTWVKTLLLRWTVRNFTGSDTVISYMDHSDTFTPQGINSVRGMKFENIGTKLIRIGNCGANCGTTKSTMSARIYSVWDWDGSLSQTGRPTILGSNLAWWNLGSGSGCVFDSKTITWRCPWTSNRHVAFAAFRVAGLLAYKCDSSVGQCVGQGASYTVGRVNLWGLPKEHGVDMSPWPGVAGHANTGWYLRIKSAAYGVDGAPSEFFIGDTIQVPRGHFFVVAVAYPATAKFSIRIQNLWWPEKNFGDMPMSTLAKVMTPTENIRKDPSTFACPVGNWWQMCTETGGVGPAWHFDGTYLYIRVVAPNFYNTNQRSSAVAFAYDGLEVPMIKNGFQYAITVTSCAGCTVQSKVAGVTYYKTPDVIPPNRFPLPVGVARATGVVGATTKNKCTNTASVAPKDLVVYDNAVRSPFHDWSWSGNVDKFKDLASKVWVKSQPTSIRFVPGNWNALYMYCAGCYNTYNYIGITFWLNGGYGNTKLKFQPHDSNNKALGPSVVFTSIAGTWKKIAISFATNCKITTKVTLNGFHIQASAAVRPAVYIDDISLVARGRTLAPLLSSDSNSTAGDVDVDVDDDVDADGMVANADDDLSSQGLEDLPEDVVATSAAAAQPVAAPVALALLLLLAAAI